MSSIAAEAARLEAEVEKQCALILRTDAEFWEVRNKAVQALTELVGKYESHPSAQDIVGMGVFRLLKEPIKSMIADLRSQQVRDTCLFLTRLSQCVGDHLRHFLRDSFAFILDGVKVPNKVMHGYVDECVINLIKNATFRTAIPTILAEIKDSKAKIVRERCLEYINEILVHWELQDRDADLVAEAVKLGLEDASVRGREIARLAYLNLFQAFPKKTERIKAGLSSAQLRAKLAAQEEQHMAAIRKQALLLQQQQVLQQQQQQQLEAEAMRAREVPPPAITATAATTVAETAVPPPPAAAAPASPQESTEQDEAVAFIAAAPVAVAAPADAAAALPWAAALESLDDAAAFDESFSLQGPYGTIETTPVRCANTPGKIALRVRRQSVQQEAVTSIQAVVRGALTRRLSVSGAGLSTPGATPRARRGAGSDKGSSLGDSPLVEEVDNDENTRNADGSAENAQPPTPPAPAFKPVLHSPPMSVTGAQGSPARPPRSASPKVTFKTGSPARGTETLRQSLEREIRGEPLAVTPVSAPSSAPSSAPNSAPSSARPSPAASPLRLPPSPRQQDSGVISARSPRNGDALTLAPLKLQLQEAPRSPAAASTSSPDSAPSSSSGGRRRTPEDAAELLLRLSVGTCVSFLPGDEDSSAPLRGVVRFVGLVPSFAPGPWVGVEVARPEGAPRGSSPHKSGGRSKDGPEGVFRDEDGVFIRAEQILAITGLASPLGKAAPPSSSSPKPAAATEKGPRSPDAREARRRSQVGGLLKLKTAQLMALLGQQLALVEAIEGAGAEAGPRDFAAEALALASQEVQLLSNFQDRLRSALK